MCSTLSVAQRTYPKKCLVIIPHAQLFSKQLEASKSKEDHSVTFLGQQRSSSWYVAIRTSNDCCYLLAGIQRKAKVEMHLLRTNFLGTKYSG